MYIRSPDPLPFRVGCGYTRLVCAAWGPKWTVFHKCTDMQHSNIHTLVSVSVCVCLSVYLSVYLSVQHEIYNIHIISDCQLQFILNYGLELRLLLSE